MREVTDFHEQFLKIVSLSRADFRVSIVRSSRGGRAMVEAVDS